MKNLAKIFFLFLAAAIIAACGSSSSDSPIVNKSNETLSKTISGTAAAGAPIVGIVNIKGANGETTDSPIELDGSFKLVVDALTAPYILYAEGTVNGKSLKIFSSGVKVGTINITPITDFILRNALKMAAETALADWTNSASLVDETTLAAAEEEVQTQLQPILNAAGVGEDVDLMTTSFNADHTGMDAVLDSVDISYDTTEIVTVTNTITDASFEDNITTSGEPGFDPSEELATTAGLTDLQQINQGMDALEALYATAKPTEIDLTAWFNTYVADDYLDGGADKISTLDAWLTSGGDEGPDVGFKVTLTIEGTFDVTGTSYTKGYKVRMTYSDAFETESSTDLFVYDGSSWLMYGNQLWVDVPDDGLSFSHMQTSDQGAVNFDTGFNLWTRDEQNYAFNQRVKSLIYTGPGLPAEGVVMEYRDPGNYFGIYDPNGSGENTWYIVTNDTVLNSIADNSEYTARLYTETADVVSVATSTPFPGQTYTFTNPKRPYLNSELSAAMFPTLITPANQNLASLNIGGDIPVAWSNPDPPTGPVVSHVDLSWWNDATGMNYQTWSDLLITATPVATSTTLDTLGLPGANGWANLFMSADDKNGRGKLNTTWQFSATAPTTSTAPTTDSGGTTTELVCGYQSGWDDAADSGMGRPINPNSFADYETVVTDCGTAQPFTVADVVGSTFATQDGMEKKTFNDSGNAGTEADPQPGVYSDGLDTFNFKWYVENATCTNCTHSYLVIYSDKTIEPNLPVPWLRETHASTVINGTGEAGSRFSFDVYTEQSNFTDLARSTGGDGEIWSIIMVKQ
ncbi:MAG: hypothetical protein P1P81_09200 [Desulfobulbales bacterium]|nr:hypothetical protein [Desulfobulbales bacterium]